MLFISFFASYICVSPCVSPYPSFVGIYFDCVLLDGCTDKEFHTAVNGMDQEQKESLMICEKSRLRSYAYCWPVTFMDPSMLAKEGFYYTGL